MPRRAASMAVECRSAAVWELTLFSPHGGIEMTRFVVDAVRRSGRKDSRLALAGCMLLMIDAVLAVASPVALTTGTYVQNFNVLGTGTGAASLPEGWDVRSDATASTLGATVFTTVVRNTWGSSTGQFRNVAAATGLSGTSSATAQNDATNRALGLRQTDSFGDPGGSFNFNFSSTGMTLTAMSFDLMLLSEQGRTTSWQAQYGLGATPSSFATISTLGDLAPSVWGTYSIIVSDTAALTAMSNQPHAWLRIVTTATTAGSGSRDTFAIDNVSVTAVPEPSTLAGLAVALVCSAAFRRRSFRRSFLQRLRAWTRS